MVAKVDHTSKSCRALQSEQAEWYDFSRAGGNRISVLSQPFFHRTLGDLLRSR